VSLIVFHKLLGIFCTVAVGWAAGRMRWLGEPAGGLDPARLLGNAAFYIFVPALLFRATARMDVATMPWSALGAFFGPAVAFVLGVYGWHRLRQPGHAAGTDLAASERAAAQPAVRAFAATFGNSAQVGVPVVAALFGEAGLGIHVALISLHALLLLTLCTMLVELDLSRTRSLHEASASLWRTLKSTVRNAVLHPVTLPVLLGALWHTTGLPLPGPLDETLVLLGSAVAPLCLVLIGITLAYTDIRTVRRAARAALGTTLLKLLVLPALVLGVAHWGLGLQGLALKVVVLMAALPTGSNALIFAQRYRTLEAEATTAIVLSTVGYMASVTLWLAVLAQLA
jgi:malonate transporter and related proteins